MRFHVITLFPEMIESAVRFGVVGQALKEGRLSVETVNPRKFTANVHQTVDDRPFGGGDGMVMLGDPLLQAVESAQASSQAGGRAAKVIHLSPRGAPLTDAKVRELASQNDLILIASRYGGIDQRFLNEVVDEEISVGDYVLSGGEIPALVLIDGVARHLPGVLGNEASAEEESFAEGLLEGPQFTRPREWRGVEVPSELLSGDHAKIEIWREDMAILVTADRRPELLEHATHLSRTELERALKRLESLTEDQSKACGLRDPSKMAQHLFHEIQRRPEVAAKRRRRRRPKGPSGAGSGPEGESK